ncbi:hypothetical protein Tco_0277943 [Tanacetum coccineum]
MDERTKVQAIKEIEKWLKEREIRQQEILVTKDTTLEANLSTVGLALDASLVTEGIALDASLVDKQSTVNSSTLSEQQNECNNSRNECSGSRNENRSSDNDSSSSGNDADVDIGPLYDSDTLSKAHHDIFENIDKEEHDYVDDEQQRAFFASLINNLNCDVEKCTKINREAQQANALLTKTAQTLHMLLPKEDSFHTGKHGLGFENQNDVENPFVLNKAKELAPSLYNTDEMGKELLSNHKIISRIMALYMVLLNINLQLSCFKKGLVKEMKDELKYVTSLEDECDEKCIILSIQREFFKHQFESAISESHIHVYENEIFEQNSSLKNENRYLKTTITKLSKQAADVKEEMTRRCAQYEKEFANLKAHCISLELKSQNKSSTSVQNGHVYVIRMMKSKSSLTPKI